MLITASMLLPVCSWRATNSDVNGISNATLGNILGLTFDGANETAYQAAIAAEASIADVAALQAVIDSVDNSVDAFASVQLAATDSNVNGVISQCHLREIPRFNL
ncbi:hypothetical protein ACFPCW_18860 [Vibrio thalassae]|uniref:hypothetical protein n=1 Tax=Vibrio thalassae TaxID=1243014 RepID=UPI00361C3A83